MAMKGKGNDWASGWNEALLIGNGRLAAMVFGGVGSDTAGYV